VQEPVDEVVEVVPGIDRVVQVERVAEHVDEERQPDQDVRHDRELDPPSREQPPGGRHDEQRDGVGQRPAGERLALELRQVRAGHGPGQQRDGRNLDRDVEPEPAARDARRGAVAHRARVYRADLVW